MSNAIKVEVDLILKKRHPDGKGLAFWDREYARGEKPKWVNLPVSQIEMDEDAVVGDTVKVVMPMWLAHNEGLV